MLAGRAAGAAAVALSGAGPGLVAFSAGQGSRIGTAMQAAFADAGLRARSFELGISEHGAQVASAA
jgi:homoserine kinase